MRDRFAAVLDALVPLPHSRLDLIENTLGVLGPGIVAGEDHLIGQALGDAAHDGPLATIAIATAAEYDGQATLDEGSHRVQCALERVGRVRVVAKDGRMLEDYFQPTRDLWERYEATGDLIH